MTGGAKQAGLVAWLVAFVVPPAVAGGLGQRFVAHHAVWAVVIGVAYEAAVAIGGFFAVVARDVSSRWQARLADRIDLLLQRTAARFERRYREFVLDGLRFMDHKGLATVGPFTPELDAVFVNVSLVPRPPQQIGPGLLPGLADERAERRALGDFLGHEKPAVLAVVGSPGSGKTTLLRHAARQTCQRKRSRRERRNHRRDIPILLYLRDHAAAITAESAVSVATLLRSTLGAMATEESPQWFEQKLREGRCLVLLDGLDEVAAQDDRAKVSAWAEGQIRQYPGNDFVISSRPQGYRSAPVEGASILQVCGFTASQTESFVRGWYQAIERHSTGTAGPEAQVRATEGADDLLQRLEQAPALYDLTVNPLLLTMIANVHRYRGALPDSRADLYSEICQVMLWRRQDAKKLTQPIGGDKKETVLRGLACAMMKLRVSDLSRADVLTQIGPALRRVSGSVTPDGFLADVSSNGLLIERETGQYAFAHKTFQEYLAAAHVRDKGLVSDLARAVNDDWWVETTLLYAATSNADPIVQACLDANSAPALALALDCTDQDSDVDPDLRQRVNDLVISAASTNADQERRRLFAGILLSRHMRQRERTAKGIQVGTRPIPAEIYRLFLADTQTPEPDASAAELGIAVGMRSSDAVAFIQWITALSGGQQGYRLPLATELTELAAQRRIPALPSGRPLLAWIHKDKTSSEALPALWLPLGGSDPYEVSIAELADAAEGDIARSVYTLSGLLLRSRILICALDHDGRDAGRVLDRAVGFGLDLGRALDRALALTLDRALILTLDRGLTLTLDRGLALTLDRGLALTLDRGLDRALTCARALDLGFTLGLAITGALDLDPDLVLTSARAIAVTVARALDRESDRALDLDRGLALNLDRVLDRARALDLDRALDRALDLDHARAHDFDRARPLDLDRARALDLDRTIDCALDLALARALDLDRTIDRDLNWGSAVDIDVTINRHLPWHSRYDLIQPIFHNACRSVLGRAFSEAVKEVLRPGSQPDRWTTRFAAAFIHTAGVGTTGHLTANPATLEAILQESVKNLSDAFPEERADLPGVFSPSAVARRLSLDAAPVFARAERPTPEKATAIRMAALCLAAEADEIKRKDIGDMFRQVAAGITLLERRAIGDSEASEVIMLAMEDLQASSHRTIKS